VTARKNEAIRLLREGLWERLRYRDWRIAQRFPEDDASIASLSLEIQQISDALDMLGDPKNPHIDGSPDPVHT
jgi:hypothetical protein